MEKNHSEELPKVENMFRKELEDIRYISTAAYAGNKTADFYINEDTMMTYVVCGENVVTCYHIDFGLDDLGNKEMLQVLLNNLERSLKVEEEFEKKIKENKENLLSNLSVLDAEIRELNASLERAIGEQKKLEQELKNIDLGHREVKEVIEVAREKIARSKMAM